MPIGAGGHPDPRQGAAGKQGGRGRQEAAVQTRAKNGPWGRTGTGLVRVSGSFPQLHGRGPTPLTAATDGV